MRKSLLGLGVLAIAAGLGLSAPALAEEFTYVSYGGAFQKAEEAAWLNPYQQQTGVKIIYDTVDYAKLKAMVESGNVTWDVLQATPDMGLDGTLFEEIDCSIVPCADLQPDKFVQGKYRVVNLTGGVVLGYNTTKMPAGKTPSSWADLFDTATFPGKRVVMMDSSSYVFEQALMADGVDPKAMYPLDLDRAIKKLNSLGKDLVIAPSYQGCAELVGSGEAVMGGCWSGRWFDVKTRAKAPVEFTWNGAISAPGYFVVPKGAKNKAAAMKFIAWALAPENNGKISDYIPYGPVNVKGLDNVKPEVKPFLITNNIGKAFFPDDTWYSKNLNEVNKRWAEWVAGVQ